MNEFTDDRLLDEYLSRTSGLSLRYRELDSDAVPEALDRQVLAQARAAVAAKTPVQRKAWVRWSAPFALAASMVVTFSILIDDETTQPMLAAPQAAAGRGAVPQTVVQNNALEPRRMPRRIQEKVTAASGDAESSAAANDGAYAVQQKSAQSTMQAGDARSSSTPSEPRFAPAPAVAAPADSGSTGHAAPVSSTTPPLLLEPQSWLERIRELRKEGKIAAADEQWLRFVESYPNYAVEPTDLARPAQEPQ